MDPNELLETALDAARAAAALHHDHLGRHDTDAWAVKGRADFVTETDREAERRIVERIRTAFPDHAILAEERADAGIAPGESDWLWIIDPLDGTTNFLHGYPAYAVSIAVARRGELRAGVVLSSATGEEWTAVRDGGAFKDGEPIRVSSVAAMPEALIGTGFPFKRPEMLPRYMHQLSAVLRATAGVRRAGSAALDLAHLATGWFDGFWELWLAPWDIAAGTLIVREAGGIVTTPAGDDVDLARGGAVLAGNPSIYRALRGLLADSVVGRGGDDGEDAIHAR
ncbi:MAG: inositol monophosphatase family protein [Gemmatimonadota bacterium]